MSTRLLICDDEAAIRTGIRLALTGQDFVVTEANSTDQAQALLRESNTDLLLLDLHFKKGPSGLDFLRQLRQENFLIPTLIISGEASTSEAVQAIQQGAYDFLEKPIHQDRLMVTINRCLEHFRLSNLLRNIAQSSGGNRVPLIGESEGILKIKKQIDQFASRDIRILILGETGTGKEVVAQNIWAKSTRNQKSLIALNCAAIPDNLLESELFGYKR